MENIIQFITNGTTDFNIETLIRYMVFVLILSCISSIADSLLSANR